MSQLFDPLKIGNLTLKNRIIMAPLTRCRSGESRIPNDLMAKYYAQRSSAGLILSEATAVSPMALGYPQTPGIWSKAQVEGWKKVTRAVHQEGGLIFMQLWHVGRISDPYYLNGNLPLAPSAIAAKGHVKLLRPVKEFVTPKALETSEISLIKDQFKQAALNAMEAGFDGVELHGANGYLIDQFLQDKTNLRDDHYGGSLENRARLPLEIIDDLISVWGADRVGYHMSPRCDSHDIGDSDPQKTFLYLARELGKRKIAFIFAREYVAEDSLGGELKKAFGGVFIANEKLTKQTAQRLLDENKADAVSFGRDFISNPDLVRRLQENISLNELDLSTLYTHEATGYVDYPVA